MRSHFEPPWLYRRREGEEDSERSVRDAKAVVTRGLPVVMSVCMLGVDVAVVAKVAQPNQRACRIQPSSHLFYDCNQN